MTEVHELKVPARVGVLGGGRMGAGIAHAFLLAGAQVVVVERDAQAAEAARATWRSRWSAGLLTVILMS